MTSLPNPDGRVYIQGEVIYLPEIALDKFSDFIFTLKGGRGGGGGEVKYINIVQCSHNLVGGWGGAHKI